MNYKELSLITEYKNIPYCKKLKLLNCKLGVPLLIYGEVTQYNLWSVHYNYDIHNVIPRHFRNEIRSYKDVVTLCGKKYIVNTQP